MAQHIKRLVDSQLNGPRRAEDSRILRMKTGLKVKTEHITDERLRGYIDGFVELTDKEQEHMLSCLFCNDRFRFFLTSNAEPKAS